MILLTDDLPERLLAIGLDRGADHVPVVKFFNPLGEGVWLATELDADGDTLFGLADLGSPELGSFSLEEMASVLLPLGRESSVTFSSLSDLGLGGGRPRSGKHPGGRAHPLPSSAAASRWRVTPILKPAEPEMSVCASPVLRSGPPGGGAVLRGRGRRFAS
jgi:hypothetical protein